MKLRNSQLEKMNQRLRHELSKSQAMTELLQSEVRACEAQHRWREHGEGDERHVRDATAVTPVARQSGSPTEARAQRRIPGQLTGAVNAVASTVGGLYLGQVPPWPRGLGLGLGFVACHRDHSWGRVGVFAAEFPVFCHRLELWAMREVTGGGSGANGMCCAVVLLCLGSRGCRCRCVRLSASIIMVASVKTVGLHRFLRAAVERGE